MTQKLAKEVVGGGVSDRQAQHVIAPNQRQTMGRICYAVVIIYRENLSKYLRQDCFSSYATINNHIFKNKIWVTNQIIYKGFKNFMVIQVSFDVWVGG